MPSLAENRPDEARIKAALLLLSVTLNAVEFFIPRIPLLPWLKPGLANIATIVWVARYGAFDALLYSVLRIWIVGFYFGFSLLTMALAFSGSLLSVLGMGLLWRLFGQRRLLGMIGIGVAGAALHNVGQLAAVYVLIARNGALFYQAPFMAGASAVSGALVGALAMPLWQAVESGPPDSAAPAAPQAQTPARWHWVVSLVFLAWSVGVMGVEDRMLLCTSALLATVGVQAVLRGSLRALIYPLKTFWMLFVVVGALHVFMTHGRAIDWLPGASREGLVLATVQWLRLWTWLQLSQLLKWSGFDRVVIRSLTWLLPRHRNTIGAAILALEYFPETLDESRKGAVSALQAMLRSPLHAPQTFVRDAFEGTMAKLQTSECRLQNAPHTRTRN